MEKQRILQILPMYHEQGERILCSGAEVIRTDRYDIHRLAELAEDVDAIVLRAPARITPEVIDAGKRLKVISGAGTGVDNIDVPYATEKGIPVLYAPSLNRVSTAEQTVALIMALAKSLIPFHAAMKRGNYNARNVLKSYELKGKKVGLIGFGQIAQEVAKRLKNGFEMDVTAWVRSYRPSRHGLAEEIGVHIETDLETVFSQSDFVSIHVPLNAETRGMIDRALLERMQKTAYLINTARGAVVNQRDLYEVLRDRKIAGAGLDVFDPEPPSPGEPLLALPNVVVSPHTGGITVESNYRMATTVAKNVLKVLKGEQPDSLFIANPEVFAEKP